MDRRPNSASAQNVCIYRYPGKVEQKPREHAELKPALIESAKQQNSTCPHASFSDCSLKKLQKGEQCVRKRNANCVGAEIHRMPFLDNCALLQSRQRAFGSALWGCTETHTIFIETGTHIVKPTLGTSWGIKDRTSHRAWAKHTMCDADGVCPAKEVCCHHTSDTFLNLGLVSSALILEVLQGFIPHAREALYSRDIAGDVKIVASLLAIRGHLAGHIVWCTLTSIVITSASMKRETCKSKQSG